MHAHLTPPRRDRLTPDDIDDLARGAAVLGTGGGGDPYIGALLAKQALGEVGSVPLVSPQDLDDDALVVPVAIMGAPTVLIEKPLSGGELTQVLEMVATRVGKEVTHVACLEAGGLSSMTPIVAAARTGLPLVDGDGMGRAFPELQMVLPTLDGVSCSPMAVCDEKGNAVVIDAVDNAWAERLARPVTTEMGCASSIALYPMTGRQAKASMVPGTLSLAQRIGAIVRAARADRRPAGQELAAALGGRVLMHGKVVDIQRTTSGGFARGVALCEGLDGDHPGTLRIDFQNEYLVAGHGGRVLASVPDLICTLDMTTGEPVNTERLRYGFRVTVVALPCDPRWRTRAGLELAGPRYFGYDHDYVPITDQPV